MVLVSGESGAGKSSLLQAFTDERVDDVPVLWGACDPLTTPRPLGPFHDLASQLGDDVVTVLDRARPNRTRSSPPCSSSCGCTPSVLIVDDLHWADQGTIDLLRFLLRRIRVTGSVVVGAMRDDEVGAAHPLRSLLGDVARSPDAETATLPPLSVDAVAALIEDRPVDAAVAAPAHQWQPLLRRRDARPRRQRDPPHGPRCHPRPHQRPRRRRLGRCCTSCRARRKRSPITCSATSASGSPPCAPSTSPG